MPSPNVAYIRPELEKVLPLYTVVDDAIEGSVRVKSRRTKYLPQPNPTDTSAENARRYRNYLDRSVFYNVTGRTLRGLVGQLFYRNPVIEVPSSMDPLIFDANGEGVNMIQLAKRVAINVTSFGRAGLFVDYPTVDGATTRADLESNEIRPVIKSYDPGQIINWRTKVRGALSILSLVVLEEWYTSKDDGFEIKREKQWRVLELIGDVYSVTIWRQVAAKQFQSVGTVIPLDAKGNTFNSIPFCFVGSENNDSEVDFVPLFDLADLNIAHYRNSADHEENLYSSAQATPVIAGITEQWADKYFKNGIAIGAYAAIPLPVGGSATLLQSSERSAIVSEMEHKERQMVALGAKLVEQKQVQRTATEAGLEEASESSVLSNIATNISSAFEMALNWAAKFVGLPDTTFVFTVNSDFSVSKLSAQERAQLISEWQSEAITFSEMRAGLRKSGIATVDDDKAETEIKDRSLFNDTNNKEQINANTA
jgi:hypothetical protein